MLFEQISQDDHDDVFQNLARDAGSKILDGSYTYFNPRPKPKCNNKIIIINNKIIIKIKERRLSQFLHYCS